MNEKHIVNTPLYSRYEILSFKKISKHPNLAAWQQTEHVMRYATPDAGYNLVLALKYRHISAYENRIEVLERLQNHIE